MQSNKWRQVASLSIFLCNHGPRMQPQMITISALQNAKVWRVSLSFILHRKQDRKSSFMFAHECSRKRCTCCSGTGDIFAVALKLPPPTVLRGTRTHVLRRTLVLMSLDEQVQLLVVIQPGLGLGLCEDAAGRPRVSGFLRSHYPVLDKSASKCKIQAGLKYEELGSHTAISSELSVDARESRRDVRVTDTIGAITSNSNLSHVRCKRNTSNAGLTRTIGPAEASGLITPGDHLLAVEDMPLAAFVPPDLRVQRCFFSLPCDGLDNASMKASISGSIGSTALIIQQMLRILLRSLVSILRRCGGFYEFFVPFHVRCK